jgi:hypothetical protein
MAFTLADLATLDAHIAKGEKTVQFSDRMVVYRSVQEMLDARTFIAQTLTARPKQTLAYSDKGF